MPRKLFRQSADFIKQLFNQSLMVFVVIAVIVVSAALSIYRDPPVGSVEFAPPKLVNDSVCVAWQNQYSSAKSTIYSVNGALASQNRELNVEVDDRAFTLKEGFFRSFAMAPGATDRVLADGDDAPLLSNFVFASEAPRNLVGFAVDYCRAPQATWWFNGITTTAGFGATLVMVNPDNTDTVVSIEAFSINGKYELGENRRIVIPGSSTRIMDLSEVMPGVKSASISIKSLDGRIVANVQSEVINGLKSRGRTYLTPLLAPAKDVVIGRIPITAKDAKLHLIATEEDAVITVVAHTASGEFALEGLNGVLLGKKKQTVFDLSRAQSGEALSLSIKSDKPILASASFFTKNRGLGDYEVVAGITAIKTSSTFLVPGSVSKAILVLGSLQDETLTVTQRTAGKVDWVQLVSVPAGKFLNNAISKKLTPGSVVTVETQDGDFYATVVFAKNSAAGETTSILSLIDPESQVSRGVRLTLAIS